jgi:hypothetical protein
MPLMSINVVQYCDKRTWKINIQLLRSFAAVLRDLEFDANVFSLLFYCVTGF